jgi:hypothetical protein
MPEIQFGVNVRAVSSQEDLQQLVRRVDDLGYDVLASLIILVRWRRSPR